MSEYWKEVESEKTNVIVVRIYRSNKETPIAVEIFMKVFFESTESVFKRAHKWADKYIETCKRYEVTG